MGCSAAVSGLTRRSWRSVPTCAIESVWSPKGVAVLVDLGGAETNSEMAIEMLGDRAETVVICNAPVVEGAVMAATEAAGGSSLAEVRATAEDFRS